MLCMCMQDVSEFVEGHGLGAQSDSEAEDEGSRVSRVRACVHMSQNVYFLYIESKRRCAFTRMYIVVEYLGEMLVQ
jgi:hypothetical protein